MSSEYMLITLDDELPEMPEFEPGIRRAPSRGFHLTEEQTKTCLLYTSPSPRDRG